MMMSYMVCPEREEGTCELVHECIDDRLGICTSDAQSGHAID
jgi:hypothetical protein